MYFIRQIWFLNCSYSALIIVSYWFNWTTVVWHCSWASVRQEAVLMTSKFWDRSYDFQCNYIKWHQEYHQFRVVFTLFVEGLTLFNQEW